MTALNAELAKLPTWKSITKRKDPLPDADDWANKPDKLSELVRVALATAIPAGRLYRSPFLKVWPCCTKRSTSCSSNAFSTGSQCRVTGIRDISETIGIPVCATLNVAMITMWMFSEALQSISSVSKRPPSLR